jgi:hypothetical protein
MTKSQSTFSSIGIDIGKEIFHVVGFDAAGKVALRKKIRRLAFVKDFEKLPPSIVGLEACQSAHFISRTLRRLGHTPRIIPALYVKPFSKGQKNDYNDAEAIAEAALRPNLRTVPEKTQDQLDPQALHRVRDRLDRRPLGSLAGLAGHGRHLRPFTSDFRARRPVAHPFPASLDSGDCMRSASTARRDPCMAECRL